MTEEERKEKLELENVVFTLALLSTIKRPVSRSDLAGKIIKLKRVAREHGINIRIAVKANSCPRLNVLIDELVRSGELESGDPVKFNSARREDCLERVKGTCSKKNLKSKISEIIDLWKRVEQ